MVQTVRNIFNFASFAFKTDTQDKEKEFQIKAYIKTDVLGLISYFVSLWSNKRILWDAPNTKSLYSAPNTLALPLSTIFVLQGHIIARASLQHKEKYFQMRAYIKIDA